MTTTATDLPDECLSLTVKGEWAHFRRVDGTVVKQTYRIIPRTTVAGLLAAIVGAERNSYYDTFSLSSASVAVTPLGELQTTNIATNGVSTAEENFRRPRNTREGRSRTGLQIRYPDTTENRQQQNYEYLVDPGYRIDVAIQDDQFESMLANHLDQGEYVYTPSLGLSECLAEVNYHGKTDIEPVNLSGQEQVTVDSAVPDSVDALVPHGRIETERSPAEMTQVEGGGRKTTAFTSYAFSPAGEPLELLANDDVGAPVVTVGNRTVMFV